MHMKATMPSISELSLMLSAMIAWAHLSRDVGGKRHFFGSWLMRVVHHQLLVAMLWSTCHKCAFYGAKGLNR
jgi:hypothetical protein